MYGSRFNIIIALVLYNTLSSGIFMLYGQVKKKNSHLSIQSHEYLGQGWPNYGPWWTSGPPNTLNIICQTLPFRLRTAVQRHLLLPVSCWFTYGTALLRCKQRCV